MATVAPRVATRDLGAADDSPHPGSAGDLTAWNVDRRPPDSRLERCLLMVRTSTRRLPDNRSEPDPSLPHRYGNEVEHRASTPRHGRHGPPQESHSDTNHDSHARHVEPKFRLGGADRSIPLDSSASPSHLRQPVALRDLRRALRGSPLRSAIFFVRIPARPGGPSRPAAPGGGRVRPVRTRCARRRPGRALPRTACSAHLWRGRSPGGRRAHREKTMPKLKKAPRSQDDGPVARSQGPAQVGITGSLGSIGSRATMPRNA